MRLKRSITCPLTDKRPKLRGLCQSASQKLDGIFIGSVFPLRSVVVRLNSILLKCEFKSQQMAVKIFMLTVPSICSLLLTALKCLTYCTCPCLFALMSNEEQSITCNKVDIHFLVTRVFFSQTVLRVFFSKIMVLTYYMFD